jgi:threonine aldolase
MSGVSIQTVRPSNGRYLVLEDIVSQILVTNDVHKGPTRGGLRDYCTLCDLASLDFSRNLGAPMRAMVLGSVQLIARLRRIRKSIGGALRQSGPVAAAAQFAFMEQFGLGPWESRGKLRAVHLLAKQVGQMWVDLGELLREVEMNLVWVDLDKAGITVDRWNELGRKYGANWRGRELFCIIRSRLILSISSVLYLKKP